MNSRKHQEKESIKKYMSTKVRPSYLTGSVWLQSKTTREFLSAGTDESYLTRVIFLTLWLRVVLKVNKIILYRDFLILYDTSISYNIQQDPNPKSVN